MSHFHQTNVHPKIQTNQKTSTTNLFVVPFSSLTVAKLIMDINEDIRLSFVSQLKSRKLSHSNK